MDAVQEENQANKKEKRKNPLQKLKEGLDDKEEQLQVLSTFVRLGVVVWSGFILTLNYVTIPGLGDRSNFYCECFHWGTCQFWIGNCKKER